MLKIDLKRQQAREVCPGGGSRYKLDILPVFSALAEFKFTDVFLPDLAAVFRLRWKSGAWEMRVKRSEITTKTKKGKNCAVKFRMI